MTDAELAEVRERVTWRGIAMIVHAWAVIITAIVMVAAFPNPLTYLLAVADGRARQAASAARYRGANRYGGRAYHQWR